jgi:hypothetical protein
MVTHNVDRQFELAFKLYDLDGDERLNAKDMLG